MQKLDGGPGFEDDAKVQEHFRNKTIRANGQITVFNNGQKQLIVSDLQKVEIVIK